MKLGELSLRGAVWQKRREAFLAKLEKASDYLNMEIKRDEKKRAVPVKHLSQPTLSRLIDAFYAGKSNEEISIELGFSEEQIKRFLAERGLRRESLVAKA